jgi:hypothetical protein
MEYFWSGGGNNRPDFTYRFTMKEITDKMFDWCGEYPLNGPFERWHIIHNYQTSYDGDLGDRKETPLIQFESRQAAYWFRLAFSEYILEDKTYSFAKDWYEENRLG